MSGFAGILTHTRVPPRAALLDAMARALGHRGGDEDGKFSTGGLGVVHTRLASLGSRADDQPLFDDDGAVLVADREFERLSVGQDQSGPIQLYRKKGLSFVTELTGPFALALYDPGEHWLILSRDLFGVKPLYYAETSEGLIFASEIKALVATGLIQKVVDENAVSEFAQLQFNCGRRTLWHGVRRVQPGETLVAQGGKVVDRSRRDALPPGGSNKLSKDQALGELEKALQASLEEVLNTESEIGVAFAGDVETSVLIEAMIARGRKPDAVIAPSLSGEPGREDRAREKHHASLLGVELQFVEIGANDFWSNLPAIAAALDDPVADYMSLYIYKLAELASDRVHVLVSSMGADEIFAGRSRYRSAMRPLWLGGKTMRSRGYLEGLSVLSAETGSWRDGISAAQKRLEEGALTKLQQAQALDAGDWLANDTLNLMDRCAMAHNVEVRYPYLEPELVRLGFRLDDDLKIAHGFGKALLRDRLKAKFSESWTDKKCRLTSVPVRDWIGARARDLGPLVAKCEGVKEFCVPVEVEYLFKHLHGQRNKRRGTAAWQLLFYALWHRIHIEGVSHEGNVFEVLAD